MTQKILSEMNEYNGKTIEYSYSEADNIFGEISNIIRYYDSLTYIQKETYFYRIEYNLKTGIISRTYTFSNQIAVENLINSYIFSEELNYSMGSTRLGKHCIYEINYIKPNGRKEKTIRVYPEWYQKLYLVKQETIIYNNLENILRIFYYDVKGNLINIK
jgi:hypothetical protein